MDFLYIGGAAAAKDRDNLKQVGITHVINCAANIAPAFFPDDFQYYNIRLRDHSSQDVARYFYNVFDFIERARKRGGKVFVHCVKGISRSPTMAIAYLMWLKRVDLYQALDIVRQARPAVDPNAGFIFQLTEWEHLHAEGRIKLHNTTVFRIDIPGGSIGNGNGARAAERPLVIGPLSNISDASFSQPSEDMAKSCYVLCSPDYMCVWCGTNASEVHVEAAQYATTLLQAYESFPDKYELVTSGQETAAFWSLVEALPPLKSGA
ncbi:hypothetical protein Poli38472_003870 [Pythium oligandrum]|uniref:Protein-tyrosine-phosphatase n=1 Tax=Pythium oligandrum TaxID=41045 RepID=A0A8K1FJI4_PYTOL|nr:hypothetical protein Poli38472_003870 [Pythium oligandrum]|eukprot:TMW66105.1 hypothetical protein Poli38472_003870 [Pythium oligandrum]